MNRSGIQNETATGRQSLDHKEAEVKFREAKGEWATALGNKPDKEKGTDGNTSVRQDKAKHPKLHKP